MAGLLNNESYAKYYKRLTQIYQKPEIRAPLEIIMSVVMVAILIFLAIRPTLTNIASLQKKIADQETMNTKADKKIGQLFNAQEQLTTYQDKLNLFDKAVASTMSYFEIVSRIEVVARNNSLTIDSVSAPGSKIYGDTKVTADWINKITKKEPDGSTALELNVSVYGSPLTIRKFLTDMENMDRLTMIRSVVLTKEKAAARTGERLKAIIQIRFLLLRHSNMKTRKTLSVYVLLVGVMGLLIVGGVVAFQVFSEATKNQLTKEQRDAVKPLDGRIDPTVIDNLSKRTIFNSDELTLQISSTPTPTQAPIQTMIATQSSRLETSTQSATIATSSAETKNTDD